MRQSELTQMHLYNTGVFCFKGLSRSGSASQGLPPTLSLVDKPKYQEKYNYLKEKYGKNLVADWPEVTDPQKFVYEDIAIAAYLLVLWDGLGIKAFWGFILAFKFGRKVFVAKPYW